MDVSKGLANLRKKEYPGRVIILGKDISGKSVVVIYAVTGRSPSSQARKIVQEKNAIWVKPTDEDLVSLGKKELLCYPACLISEGIAISNGQQTVDVQKNIGRGRDAVGVLKIALESWEYEPDEPAFTPRISGCVLPSGSAALSIIKRAKDDASHQLFFDISLIPGKGKMIATYEGPNINPLPSFKSRPLDVALMEKDARKTAEAVYVALKQPHRKEDFRVGVACLFCQDLERKKYSLFIINRNKRENI